jgi:hypothetical protein
VPIEFEPTGPPKCVWVPVGREEGIAGFQFLVGDGFVGDLVVEKLCLAGG